MSTFVLWDIDGTLIQNTPTAGTLYLEAIEHVTGVRPTVPVENPHGMTEGQLLTAILEANDLDPARLGEVLFDLDVISREQYERGQVRELCEGVEHALAAVAERGWTNALLTGNGPNRARYKLLAAGLNPEDFDWDHSYFGHQSPTRHHLTAGARDALSGHSAFIVGDTPNDGLAADSARIPFVAVATGVYSREQLAATSAVVVLDDLTSGLDALLAAVDAATGSDAQEPADAVAAAEADAAVEAPEPDAPVDGAEAVDAVSADAEPAGDEPVGTEQAGAEPDVEPVGDELAGAEPAEPAGAEPAEPDAEPVEPLAEADSPVVDATDDEADADIPADEIAPPVEAADDEEPPALIEPRSSIAPGPSTEPPVAPTPAPEPSIVPPPEPAIVPDPEPLIEPSREPGPLIEPPPGPAPQPSPEPAPGQPGEPSEPAPEPAPGPVRNRDENSDTGELHRV